jgi:membrane associated rhomboid family serine protease
VSTPAPDDPGTVVRARLPFLVGGAAVFVVLLVIAVVTQNNAMGSVVAIYGIIGGVLLGRLLARAERSDPAVLTPDDASPGA